jgi:shikimate kinase
MSAPQKTNICLVGFMGTGKSAAGRLVAEKLGKEFVETDDIVEKLAGKTIPEIFQTDGELRFRELEIAAVKAATLAKNVVISFGGGAVLNHINVLYAKRLGVVICLVARPDVVYERILSDGPETRPLLAKPDPMGKISRLLEFRAPFYAAATDLILDTSDLDPEATCEAIIALYQGT